MLFESRNLESTRCVEAFVALGFPTAQLVFVAFVGPAA